MFSKIRSIKLEIRTGNKKVKRLFSIFCFFCFSIAANAQCAMCRAALTGDANKVQGQAVNDGIVYLMVIPYLLVAAIGYYVYQTRKKGK